MFTAFSMISIDSRTVIRLRRRKTPAVPIENRTADRIRYMFRLTMSVLAPGLSGDDDRPDHRDEDQDRGHFEGERVRREEHHADLGDVADRGLRRLVGAERGLAE